jgi:hypothetical protein
MQDVDGSSVLSVSGICRIPGIGFPAEISSTISSKLGPFVSFVTPESVAVVMPVDGIC